MRDGTAVAEPAALQGFRAEHDGPVLAPAPPAPPCLLLPRGWRWVGVEVAEAALSVLLEDMLTPSRQAIIAALGYYHLWI